MNSQPFQKKFLIKKHILAVIIFALTLLPPVSLTAKEGFQCTDSKGRNYLSFSPCDAVHKKLKRMDLWLEEKTYQALQAKAADLRKTPPQLGSLIVKNFVEGRQVIASAKAPELSAVEKSLQSALRDFIREELNKTAPKMDRGVSEEPDVALKTSTQSNQPQKKKAFVPPMNFGKKLRAARQTLGWNLEQLSAVSGIDIRTLQAVEKERSRLDPRLQRRLETILFGTPLTSGKGNLSSSKEEKNTQTLTASSLDYVPWPEQQAPKLGISN
ncbi:helix-turn-helix domain-containing protein [Magnetococcales bacterium HHB-1]